MSISADDPVHMAHALRLAARGLGNVWPNPAVGCVILQDDRVVGRGWTQPGGRPHAETCALDQAGSAARGAVAYVTLEPCAHHGKTPPCAGALITAGVSRVVSALIDPDARVAGRGHSLLREAGITVTEGILAPEAARLNAGFLKRVTRDLPFVTLKLATTLDGRIATTTGDSRWITGTEARAHGHSLRMTHDAVLVGSGTAIADDPELTVRGLGSRHQPVRIVMDRLLRHSPDSRLGNSARQAPVWMIHGPQAPDAARAIWQATGAVLIEIPLYEGRLDPVAALRALAARGITRVLCEGGGTLAAALIRTQQVDDVVLYFSGVLIGADGFPALGQLGVALLSKAPRFTLRETRRLGPDIFALWSQIP